MNSTDAIRKVMKDTRTTATRLSELMGYATASSVTDKLRRKHGMRVDMFVKMLDMMGYEVVVRKQGGGGEIVICEDDDGDGDADADTDTGTYVNACASTDDANTYLDAVKAYTAGEGGTVLKDAKETVEVLVEVHDRIGFIDAIGVIQNAMKDVATKIEFPETGVVEWDVSKNAPGYVVKMRDEGIGRPRRFVVKKAPTPGQE